MRFYRHRPRSMSLQAQPPLSPAECGIGGREGTVALFAMPSPLLLFPPPVAVHDISTMETARARPLLSHSTSFRTRLSNLLPTSLPLILLSSHLSAFPSLHLSSSFYSSSICFSAFDRGGVEHFISFLRSLPFSFAKSRTLNGRRNRFPAVLSVNSFGFHDGGLLAFTVIAAE